GHTYRHDHRSRSDTTADTPRQHRVPQHSLSGGRDIDIDQRLRLWITIRDRGLHHFAARATSLTREDLERLIAEIERMTPQTGGLKQA
ncbi:hypothetical protein ACFWG3_27400, partial [Rhodococcus aetherivorans]